MNNPAYNMADSLKLEAQYLGLNGVKQHLFGSPGPLVNFVFNTLEEAVTRFGKRIKIDEKTYAQSANFRQGYAAATYAPRSGADRVERIEYGLGYLKRLIEKVEAVPKPKPPDMRLPHEVLADRAKAEKARAAKPVAPVAVEFDAAPTKADMAKGIAVIAKKRGAKPKAVMEEGAI